MRRCTKPRWVGKKTGPNPTDRAKTGTKRHHLTDGAGMPISVALTAANRPDKESIGALLDARIVRAPAHIEQHLCLDKGYDYADAERAVRWRRYVPHIRRRGEERRACRRGTRARRWVVERATSWFNRCRRLLSWMLTISAASQRSAIGGSASRSPRSSLFSRASAS